MMEGGPLLEQWWITMASDTFIPYLNITSRLRTTPDQELLQAMGGRGFPYFVVLDPDGQRIVPGKAYPQFRPMNRAGTEVALTGAQELIAARVASANAPEDAALAANRTLLERLLVDGKISDENAAKAAAVVGADPVLVQRFRVQEVLIGYSEEVRGVARDDLEKRQAAFDRAARAMLQVHRTGRGLYDTRLRVFGDYWRLVFTGAILDGDASTAEAALTVYRRVYGTNANARERLVKMQQDLDDLNARIEEAKGEGG